jgi:hypothetical protein
MFPSVDVEVVGEQHLAFRINKKTFAYYLFDHHGDGRIAFCCKSSLSEQRRGQRGSGQFLCAFLPWPEGLGRDSARLRRSRLGSRCGTRATGIPDVGTQKAGGPG